MELRDYIRILQKHWVLIALITLIGTCAAIGYSVLTPPTYEAKTQLYVTVRTDSQGSSELVQGSNFAQQSVQSYVNVVNTESVLRPVVESLEEENSVADLSERVSASAPEDTSLIEITVNGGEAEAAAATANAVGESLINVVQGSLESSGDGDSPVKLTTVQEAKAPDGPVSPRLGYNAVIGILGGLIIGLFVAGARHLLDTRIHSIHDAEQVTEATMLGGIPFDRDSKTRPLVVHAEPSSPRTEAYRALRTNLQFLTVSNTSEEEGNSFVISSAGSGEGKSTTSANLAIVLAESGKRVMLIDGDLRLPKIAGYMGIEGASGLTDVLIGRAEPTEVVQKWGRRHLFIMPSGRIPPNPSELLGSQAMESLLVELHKHFDYIVIDAPPLLSVTDAAVISKYTNGAILAVASGRTRKPSLRAAVRTLETAGGRVRGIIVTMLPEKGPDSYGYGAYGDKRYGHELTHDMSLSVEQTDKQVSPLDPLTQKT